MQSTSPPGAPRPSSTRSTPSWPPRSTRPGPFLRTAVGPAVAAVAAQDPHCLQAWADLAELADDPIDRYAFARVGYHRGLDALRAAGWRGSGYVALAERAQPGLPPFAATCSSWRRGRSARSTRSSAATSSCASSTPNGAPGSPERRLPRRGPGVGPPHVVRVSNCMMVEVSVTSPPSADAASGRQGRCPRQLENDRQHLLCWAPTAGSRPGSPSGSRSRWPR